MSRRRKILLYYAGLGDSLLAGTIAYHLARQEGCRMIAGTPHPELLAGNPLVYHLPTRSQATGHQLTRALKALGMAGSHHYLRYQEPSPEKPGTWLPPADHILKVLARQAGLEQAPERPVIFLSPQELKDNALRLPQDGKPWIAMQSTGVTNWTENKNWGGENFRQVSARLKAAGRIVQFGLESDPALDCDLDLRGQLPVREAVATLAACALFVGQPGFLMHAAAAVEVPAVIVYGGFEAPWQSGYAWNRNLFTQLDCSPCWLTTACPYGKACLARITPDQVAEAAVELLGGKD